MRSFCYICVGAGMWRTSPGDRIAVDTAETGEQQPLHARRISSKSGVSGSGGGRIRNK